MMRTVSLRVRLTLWYTVVLIVALALFGIDVLFVQERLGIRRSDRELDALHETIANIVRAELEERESPESAAKEARDTVVAPDVAVAVIDAGGSVLASRLAGLDPGLLQSFGGEKPNVSTIQSAGTAWRIHSRPVVFDGPDGKISLVVLVGSTLADIRREQHGIREAMLVAIPIALVLAGVGGLMIASIGLRPITEMAETAARIAPGGTENLGDSGRTDELGQLARAFNGLVARLRAALQTQRQFMADASHELRTPVSVVRTASDVALARDRRDEVEYRETLTIVNDQARRLSRLVEDMLVLARAEAGGYTLAPVDLYLDEVIGECRRGVEVLAADRGVSVRASTPQEVPFRGDEALLQRLVLNLVQNAVQHTPAGGSVGIDLRTDPGGVAILVSDTGSGIPDADRGRIFDRFVQLDPSRRTNGTGLGLPIAKWIAEAHGGTLTLESSGPAGSSFRVWLPNADGG